MVSFPLLFRERYLSEKSSHLITYPNGLAQQPHTCGTSKNGIFERSSHPFSSFIYDQDQNL
ncbi:hypothetical protein DA89_2579 [Vibrio paracholerae]|nr:hypothetical protein DA89_2579 [Vibrio paracholerae]